MGRLSRKRLIIYSLLFTVIALVLIWFSLSLGHPKNLIVLLEDPDGKVGELEVTGGGGGRQVLSKSHQATGASSADEVPRAPFIISDEEINEIFGDVINGRPALPVSFTLFFQPGTSILASAGEQIDRIVAEVQRRPISAVSIYGLAGDTGNVTLNLGVSLLRARSVSFALASRGLDRSRFIIESLVDKDPVALPPGVSGSVNLRVEVVIR